MTNTTLSVGGMSCVRCSTAVENALKSSEGILTADVSFVSNKANITYDEKLTNINKIEKTIKKAGYFVVEDREQFLFKSFKRLRNSFIISAILSVPFLFMMFLMVFFPDANLTNTLHSFGYWQLILAIPIQFGVGFRFYKGAISSIINKSPGMDLLIAMGTSTSFIYSTYNLFAGNHNLYYESCVLIITFVILGKLLESYQNTKTTSAITGLLKLTPNYAMVLKEENFVQCRTDEIVPGDIILVRNGENIPVDGIIISGKCEIDESMLTGESKIIQKSEANSVFGGTTLISGSINIKATHTGANTVVSGIINLVEKAQSSKAKIQTTVDKVSAYFVPTVFLIAIITFTLSLLFGLNLETSITRGVSVIVVACPCSLGIATPTALSVGIGMCAKKGILIKDANTLENMCKIKAILFDKTGTITIGKPKINAIITNEISKTTALELASAVEKHSQHPLALAILEYQGNAQNQYVTSNFHEIPGLGVECEIDGHTIFVGRMVLNSHNIPDIFNTFENNAKQNNETVIYLTKDNQLLAAFSLSDQISVSAKDTIDKLKSNDIVVAIASGDNKYSSGKIAKEIGISNFYSELLPKDKLEIYNSIKKEYGICAFVGDGINDAPVLTAADIGFSLSSGSDIAIQSGNVILTTDNISLIPEGIRLSKETIKKIRQNLFWAFFYNCATIPLAAFGVFSPIIAGLAMSLSSVSVLTNSLLLKRHS